MTQRPMSREDEDIIDNGTIANRIVDNQLMEDDLEDPEIIENDQFDGLVEDEQVERDWRIKTINLVSLIWEL